MTMVLAATFMLVTGASAEDELRQLPSLPGVGTVDMQDVQNQVDALLRKAQDQQMPALPVGPSDGKKDVQASPGEGSRGDEGQTENKAAAQEAAQCAMQQFLSKDRQQELKQETDRLQREMIGQEGMNQQPQQNEGQIDPHEAVYVFLSSSMPAETIWAYLERIAAITATKGGKVVPVMYGLVQGIEGKAVAAEYISQIMKVDGQCQDAPNLPCDRFAVEIRINPLLFAKYAVSVVPSVVYDNKEAWWSVQGDASLDHLLEEINRDAHSQTIASFITTMRRKNR